MDLPCDSNPVTKCVDVGVVWVWVWVWVCSAQQTFLVPISDLPGEYNMVVKELRNQKDAVPGTTLCSVTMFMGWYHTDANGWKRCAASARFSVQGRLTAETGFANPFFTVSGTHYVYYYVSPQRLDTSFITGKRRPSDSFLLGAFTRG
jgi:hypothetical protein